jgi:hypothetical protein
MALTHRVPAPPAVTRLVNRTVGLAHRLIGFGAHTPAEPLPWAELATDRALHDITHEAETRYRPR